MQPPKPTVNVPDLWNDNFIKFGSLVLFVGTLRNYAHGYCLLFFYLHIAVTIFKQNSRRKKETDFQVFGIWHLRYRYGRCHIERIFFIGALFNRQYRGRDLKREFNGLYKRRTLNSIIGSACSF